MGNRYMFCSRCSMYGRVYHNKEITNMDTDIQFIDCLRENGYLKTITFQCGENTVTISADSESKRILVSSTSARHHSLQNYEIQGNSGLRSN